MKRVSSRSSFLMVVACAIVLTLPSLTAQTPKAERKILLQQDLPIPGYEVVQGLGIIPPGGREGKHTHPGTLVGYVMEGEVTIESVGHPTVTYKTGQSFIVKQGVVHEGINNGKVPFKAAVTFIIEKGKPLATPVK